MEQQQYTSTPSGREELTGRTFGRLTVIGYSSTRGTLGMWLCRCECGQEKVVYAGHLKRMEVRSCGCLRKETTRARSITHGDKHSKEYVAWCGMKRRCYAKKATYYYNYGGRGIEVCREWKDSYETFLRDMGRAPSPSHTLDRINNDMGYSKANCRWATRTEQMNNTRHNIYLVVNGETISVGEASQRYCVPCYDIQRRLRSGWTGDRAVMQPVCRKPKG